MNTELVKVVEVKPAVVPESLTEVQKEEIDKKAEQAINSLVLARGSNEIKIAEEISNVGILDQKSVASNVQLLQERMGNVFYSENKQKAIQGITKDVSNLKNVLGKINPKDLQNETKYKIMKMIPFFGDYLVTILKDAASKQQTLQEFVEHLEDSLQHGEIMLRQDNAELTVIYESIEKLQEVIAKDAYFAEVLMEKLETAIKMETDEKKKSSLNKLLFQLSVRAQDLRAIEHINEQFFISIAITRDGNKMHIASVQRMLTMGSNVVMTSMAINAALMRQKNVLEVVKGTREFIGNMIVRNAQLINENIKEVGDVYKQPFIAVDKLEKAAGLLKEAIDMENSIEAETIESAKNNTKKIKMLTEDIRNKSGQLPNGEIKSLEVSKVLALNSEESK